VKPLRSQEVIAASRRDDFVSQVFWNVHEILGVNQPLAEKLTKRQKQQPIVQSIGDLFLERVPFFEPFVTYGAHQLFGKYEFEKEKGANPAFQKFVDVSGRVCCLSIGHPIACCETLTACRKPSGSRNRESWS
jgi:hypothetical protein